MCFRAAPVASAARWSDSWNGRRNYRLSKPTRFAIVPQLGTHRLDKLKPAHVQAWLNDLLTRVSAGTARNAYNRLHTALGVAVKWRLVAENVAGLIDPPRSTPRPIQALTIEQAGRLLEAVKGHRLYALYYLALRLGLREAELLGLLWADLDWQRPGQALMPRHVGDGVAHLAGSYLRHVRGRNLETLAERQMTWYHAPCGEDCPFARLYP